MLEGAIHLLAVVAYVAMWPLLVAALIQALVAAEAIACLLVDFRVRCVTFGSGPCVRACWIRGVRIEWHLWPFDGFTAFAPRGTENLKSRLLVVTLAGPLTLVALGFLGRYLGELEALVGVDGLHVLGLRGIEWFIWSVAASCFLPVGGRSHPSYGRMLWQLIRSSRAELESSSSYWHNLELEDRHELPFLLGDAATSERVLRERLAANSDDFGPLSWLAILRASVGDFDDALAYQNLYEAKLSEWMANHPASDAATRMLHRQLRRQASIHRAFHLALRSKTEDVAEARKLSESWGPDKEPWSESKVAIQRTRGFVLLHTEEKSRARNCLRRAISGSEPYWLRAIGMACLALAHAELREPSDARNMLRRARRLHPQSLLVPQIAAKVDTVLAAS